MNRYICVLHGWSLNYLDFTLQYSLGRLDSMTECCCKDSFPFMEAIENLDDLLGAVAVCENCDLFLKIMQTTSS